MGDFTTIPLNGGKSGITAAREAAASAYPEYLTDSLGRVHPSIPRKAILSGAWDHGEVVRKKLADEKERRG